MSNVRWWIVGLLFVATTLCYLDRIVFSFLAPEIRTELHFTPQVYGYMTAAFEFAYMVGLLFSGLWIDRVGTRIGFATMLGWWSTAAALHCIARTALPEWHISQTGSWVSWAVGCVAAPLVSLVFWRAMLGLGESGNFPAAIKSVAEWFPPKDRALATGIFNAGSNVGAMLGPPVLAILYAARGWRICFLITGSLGFLWILLWLATYHPPEKHRGVNRAELEYIRTEPLAGLAGEDGAEIGWKKAFTFRETWGFSIAKFLTNPVWMFYLWWLPLYLDDVYKVTPKQRGFALMVVYLAADVGSVVGGWISGYLMRRGWAHGRSRKAAMTMCALCMPVGAAAVLAHGVGLAVALVSIATFGHQGWSANLFTTVSDVFPKRAVASVVGIGGCGGALGSFLFSSLIAGHVIAQFGYRPMFLAMGGFHLTALGFVYWLMRGAPQPGAVDSNPSVRVTTGLSH
jgi:ACS family hexuronate transporter-like MFS transporter